MESSLSPTLPGTSKDYAGNDEKASSMGGNETNELGGNRRDAGDSNNNNNNNHDRNKILSRKVPNLSSNISANDAIDNASKRRMVDGKETKEHKRRKWEAKQAQKQHRHNIEQERLKWICDNSNFASWVEEQDIIHIIDEKQGLSSSAISPTTSHPLTVAPSANNKGDSESLSKLLEPYFNIQENKNNKKKTTEDEVNEYDDDDDDDQQRSKHRLFIAEGTETIRILIQQSKQKQERLLDCDDLGVVFQPMIQVKSIFVKPTLFFDKPVYLRKDVDDLLTKQDQQQSKDDEEKKTTLSLPHPASSSCHRHHPGFHILVAKNETVLSRVAGYQISRGILACGVIPHDYTEEWLMKFVTWKQRQDGRQRNKIRLLALDGICDTSNMGSMIRCASAFSIDAIILSNDCCDPWYRRSIRVSMGHIFKIPIVRVTDLATTIQAMSTRSGIRSYAAILETNCLLSSLEKGDIKSDWCCILGNEGNGISTKVVEAATQKIRIDIAAGVDSLSAPIACGILLHGLKEREESIGGT